ncbi:ABC-type Mn2+/Zn2+ transport system ATPase subunit [Pseudomonas sp. BIGb0408]|uniref:ABC-type Mn2+/Zn2+ transport system ATPase subunit n=1 Tax=Phytopseudomonas flavescens TaxID=29435 RepID=A0A7Z0BMA2_9GAMM|nr:MULTISPECIES: AAA family ATPase [Pseudomonas]MCW2293167.1 ABC-type Mn2+/Zn2+ transport system ATPase subunit [Pseudomonas sp. BIGb0408]NYH72262.1 ABC-type Mn2+/Zn2+ transport system ATPase subunit [Pseudomonas flavescens]
MIDQRNLHAHFFLEKLNKIHSEISPVAVDIEACKWIAMYYIVASRFSLDSSAIIRYSGAEYQGLDDINNIEDRFHLLKKLTAIDGGKNPAHNVSQGSARALFKQLPAILPSGYEDVIAVFDHLYDLVVQSQVGSSFYHSREMAEFCTALAGSLPVVEYTPYNLEVSVAHKKGRDGISVYVRDAPVGIISSAIILKKIVHGFEFIEGDFALVGLHREAEAVAVIDDAGRTHDRRSFEVVEEVLLSERSQEVVIYVPDYPWQQLKKVWVGGQAIVTEYLEAVVDLATTDFEGIEHTISVWVFNKNKPWGQPVYLVNSEKLLTFSPKVSTEDAARFVANLLNYRRGAGSSFAHSRGALDYIFQQITASYASREIEKHLVVPGLSKNLTVERVGLSRLMPASLIQTPIKSLDLEILDPRRILNSLEGGNSVTYVIGDNGAGKSLLLKSILKHLKNKGRRTVGLSFSCTDRFPFNIGQGNKSGFLYKGARTSKDGISIRKSNAQIHSALKQVFSDQHLLDQFSLTLGMLGFSKVYYLLSTTIPDRLMLRGGYVNGVLELSQSAAQNAEILTEHKHHEFSFARESAANAARKDVNVVRVSELSSGEQQVVSLVASILISCDSNAVFLVDEPETSLHVKWQQLLPQIISNLSARLNCSFVVATHSPTLIVNSSNLDNCFLAADNLLTPIELPDRQSVETVLMEGFKIYTPNNRDLPERCASLVSRAIKGAGLERDMREELLLAINEELNAMLKTIEDTSLDSQSQSIDPKSLIGHAEKAIHEILRK